METWDKEKTDFNLIVGKSGGHNFKDITGQKFERLTVLYPIRHKLKVFWVCKCDCGKEIKTNISMLKRGNTKSCGCLNIEKIKLRNSEKTGIALGDITTQYIKQVKYNAERRNIDYVVSDEYIWNLYLKQNKKCIFSGLDLCFGKRHKGEIITASLDRIDSSKGYIEGNVQWTHKDVNKMKFEKSNEEFIKICNLIVENTRERYCGTE